MGLKARSILGALFLFAVAVATSQSKLTSASVKMMYDEQGERFHIKEKLFLDTIQAGQVIRCKALRLTDNFTADTDNIAVSFSGRGEVDSFSQAAGLQTFQATMQQAEKDGWIELSYMVDELGQVSEIPLFFTEFAAASSEEDFFSLELEIPEERSAFFHFPTAKVLALPAGSGNQLLSFSIPALPSMVRLELAEDVSNASFQVTLIDLGVALVFVLIGFLIFRYRKMLIYG